MYKILIAIFITSILSGCASKNKKVPAEEVLKEHEHVVQEETRVRLGVPSDMPIDLLRKLYVYFQGNQNVRYAKLGLMETLHSGKPSEFQYTIGVNLKNAEQLDDITAEMITIAKTAKPGRWPIAFVPLTSDYFTEEAIVFYSARNKK